MGSAQASAARASAFERKDDLQVGRRADPHGVGIDEFLDDVGSGGISAVLNVDRGNAHI